MGTSHRIQFGGVKMTEHLAALRATDEPRYKAVLYTDAGAVRVGACISFTTAIAALEWAIGQMGRSTRPEPVPADTVLVWHAHWFGHTAASKGYVLDRFVIRRQATFIEQRFERAAQGHLKAGVNPGAEKAGAK